jgi:hypothetical protein
MVITIYRPTELYSQPAKGGRPAKRGIFGVGKSFFYDVIEPLLEKVNISERAVGYTDRSINKVIEDGIATAAAERAAGARTTRVFLTDAMPRQLEQRRELLERRNRLRAQVIGDPDPETKSEIEEIDRALERPRK